MQKFDFTEMYITGAVCVCVCVCDVGDERLCEVSAAMSSCQ